MDQTRASARDLVRPAARATPGATIVSDADLADGLQRGRHVALAEAYERHSAQAHALARRLCGAEQADDVVQEVFLRLWERPWTYDPLRGSLRSFIMMTTHGRSIDLLRNGTSRRNREHAVQAALCHVEDFPFATSSDGTDYATWELLSRLPATQSEPIFLAYFAGYTYREVAEALGQPDGTIKTRIRTGLAQLRALLIAEGQLEPD